MEGFASNNQSSWVEESFSQPVDSSNQWYADKYSTGSQNIRPRFKASAPFHVINIPTMSSSKLLV